MELLHPNNKMLSSFSLTFLLHFSSLLFPSSSYTLPNYYFINCGSHSSLFTFQRNFTGDQNPSTFSLSSSGTTSSAANQTLPLYQTARVFTKPSSYNLNLDQPGTYILRFHFFPFPSLGNPQFHVSAAGFSLLSNFTAQSGGRYGFPIVEEFLIKASTGKLKINFNPAQKDRSFAFVNAIEVFLAPPELIPDYTTVPIPRMSDQGDNGDFNSALGDFTLRVLHRINVGGGNVTREIDTLMRYWVPDDPYLLSGNTSKSHTYTDEIKYRDGGATRFIAPDSVYNTAKEMITNSSGNISWRFEVKKGVNHLLRLHFCDIVSDTSNENFKFNLFIDGDEPYAVFPWDRIPQGAAPFYIDRVVESDDSGFVNVSVGPNSESGVRNAMLNGVEIMELLTDKASDSGDGSGKRLFLILGLCIGGLILALVVFGVVFLRFRKRKVKQNGVLNWPLGSSYSRTTARTSVTGTPFADLNLGLKIPLPGILFATKHFDAKLMIGEGGFGKVYKGTLRNGIKVAIKRSEGGHGQGFEEFHTEIRVLSKIRHQHLRKGELEKVVDPCLEGKINPNSLRKFGETVEKCLQDNGADRPNMVDVLWDLEYCRQLQHSAVPRQPYEDTTTEVSWGVPMPVLQRLPTDSFTIEEDDSVSRSFSGVVSSQNNGSEVFSLLDMDGAR
ncbi:hypothetical protein SASPL_152004 [Salvia splendens]|uniref:Uncharacterized protein n=1 Tax=Salvia splendens TaxID=180675 RepID=A0A8X8W2H5_SALSN|nr:hypothetical protein SASPL_152004 [Salvia splendens]